MISAVAKDLVEQGGELLLQTTSWGGGVGRAGGGLVSEAGSDFQSFAGLRKAELVQVVRIHVLEVALGGVEEDFRRRVLSVAKGSGAGGGIELVFAMDGRFDLRVLLDELGGAGLDAAAPIEIGGPALDGAERDAKFAADESVTAARTKLPVGAEALKSAVGFPAGRRELEVSCGWRPSRRDGGWLMVES